MLRIFRHYIPGLMPILLVGDLAVIVGSLLLTSASGIWIGAGPQGPKLVFIAVVEIFLLYVADLYNTRLPLGRREMVARLLICQAAAAPLVAAGGYALPSLRLGRLAFLELGIIMTLGLLFWRAAWLGSWSLARMTIRVLVVGSGPIGKSIADLGSGSARPFKIIGYLDDDPAAADSIPVGHELLGKIADLSAIVEETRPDVVLVVQQDRRGRFPANQLLECRLRGITVEDWPTFYEKATGKILVTELRPSWLIFSDGFVKTARTEIIKRLFDVTLASVGLILAAPLMVLAAIAIKVESAGPVLYRQPRSGQNGCVFILNKFRSMRRDAEEGTGPVWAQRRDPRVTRVGALLRRMRLDELPQLFNVLLGHMSFIGPRPERPEFVHALQKEIPYYMKRLSMKPGITGWAQVKYGYGANVDDALEKLQYDLYYIKNLSLFLDLLILLNTVQVVLFARGR
jgi:sugar transferase (PEP-CTERM system associated)